MTLNISTATYKTSKEKGDIFKKVQERQYETRILYQFNYLSILKVVENVLIDMQKF